MDKTYRILSLDGGGIRGVLTAYWLYELEKLVGGSLRDHFDLIAGTSTGSILACGVAAGISAEEILMLYSEQGHEVFPSTGARLWGRTLRTLSEGVSAPKYDGVGLKRALEARFGAQRFGSLPVTTLVTTYDTMSRQATIFKSNRPMYQDIPIWQVCKASSSAPTYFPAEVIQLGGARLPFVDGGVVANNPTACAIAEGIRINSEIDAANRIPVDRFVVASFGTGESTRPIPIESAKEWGALEWAIPIISVLFDGSADATDYIAAQIIARDNYFRFQTRLDTAYDDMDDASNTNVAALKSVALAYLQHAGGRDKLGKLAKALKR